VPRALWVTTGTGRQTKRNDKQYTKHNVPSTSDNQHCSDGRTTRRVTSCHVDMHYNVHTALLRGRRLYSCLLTTHALYEYRSTVARSLNVYTTSTTLIPFQSKVAGKNKTRSELIWGFTQRRTEVRLRRFGTTYRVPFQPNLDFLNILPCKSPV
jgi:hypothetical protein